MAVLFMCIIIEGPNTPEALLSGIVDLDAA